MKKTETLLADKSKIKSSNKRGGKRFLKEIGTDSDWVLDEEAIKRNEQFDGYYGIQTSEKNLSAEEVLDMRYSRASHLPGRRTIILMPSDSR